MGRIRAGPIFIVFAGLLFFRDRILSLDTINGSSMAPTLSPTAHETGQKDWVLIRRDNWAWKVQRGDIVTFWKPHRPDEISIKRIVAVEGDTVYPRRGYSLDGGALRARRLGLLDGVPGGGIDDVGVDGERVPAEAGKVVVPYGHVWVEGDNWRRSFDSNDFGPVSKALIDGKAVRVLRGWQWREIGDGREKGRASRVVQGRDGGKLPNAFVD